MDDVWQVQEAKARFGEVIDRALSDGPQTVTRHGKPVVQVIALDERAVSGGRARPSLGEFLLQMPKVGPDGLPPMPRSKSRKPPKLGD
jgi:prevent-host-death family protein